MVLKPYGYTYRPMESSPSDIWRPMVIMVQESAHDHQLKFIRVIETQEYPHMIFIEVQVLILHGKSRHHMKIKTH